MNTNIQPEALRCAKRSGRNLRRFALLLFTINVVLITYLRFSSDFTRFNF